MSLQCGLITSRPCAGETLRPWDGGGGSASTEPGVVIPLGFSTGSGQSRGLLFPLPPCQSCALQVKKRGMSYKRKAMCQFIFYNSTKLLYYHFVAGGHTWRGLCVLSDTQWLKKVWPCGVGGACRQLGARHAQHCRVWGGAVPVGAEPQNRVF